MGVEGPWAPELGPQRCKVLQDSLTSQESICFTLVMVST